MNAHTSFERLYAIVAKLRAPDGCPWDRKQTPESMTPFILEETYECIEALEDRDYAHVKEELGDLFMLVTMVAYMAEQEQRFGVAEVLESVSDKLIRRHPHVFADAKASTSEEVIKQWSAIKENVEGRKGSDSVLSKVPKSMPPLERAYHLQRRAKEAGFDWKDIEGVWAKISEETAELKAASADGGETASSKDRVEEEYGDLLFSVVNLARFLKVDPSVALHNASRKFSRRFEYVERSMLSADEELSAENFHLMDRFWDEAKTSDRSDSRG